MVMLCQNLLREKSGSITKQSPIMTFFSGAFCAMMGILCMSFPVPVFVSHFNYLYNQEKADYKFRPEDFMVIDGKKPDFEKFENVILPSILQAKTAASRATGETFDMSSGTRRGR